VWGSAKAEQRKATATIHEQCNATTPCTLHLHASRSLLPTSTIRTVLLIHFITPRSKHALKSSGQRHATFGKTRKNGARFTLKQRNHICRRKLQARPLPTRQTRRGISNVAKTQCRSGIKQPRPALLCCPRSPPPPPPPRLQMRGIRILRQRYSSDAAWRDRDCARCRVPAVSFKQQV
jgi:hypothetical protein